MLGLKCRTFSIDLLGYGFSDKPDPRCAPVCRRLGTKLAQVLAPLTGRRGGRQFPPNELYCFETWAAQVLDFIREKVQAPAFLVCNSVGGAHPWLPGHVADRHACRSSSG